MPGKRTARLAYLVETAWLYCLSLLTTWLLTLLTRQWWGAAWRHVKGEPMPLPRVPMAHFPWGQWLTVAIGMAAAPVAWELLLRRTPLADITGRAGRRCAPDLLWAAVASAAVLIMVAAGLAATRTRLAAALTTGNLLFLSLHWLVNAAAEETLYRGVIQRRLCRLFGNPWGIALAAAVHALLGHPGAPFVENLWLRFPVSLVFGALYCWRRGLLAPAAAHWLVNMAVTAGFPLRR